MKPSEFDEFLHIVRRSPSPHNTQPFSWRQSDNTLTMLVNSERILHVSDKELRDLHLSAGATYKLAEYGLKKIGFVIESCTLLAVKMQEVGKQEYLKLEIAPGPKDDPSFLPLIYSRACYRGVFDKASNDIQISLPNTVIIKDRIKMKAAASLYDEALTFFMSQADYANELWQWLRLNKKHPKYNQDGLNAESLRLNSALAFFSSFIMKPAVLKFFDNLGILKLLISEAPQNTSAEGLLLMTRDHTRSLFEQGKDLYTAWLELEKQGRCFCPITSLIDEERFERQLAHMTNVSGEIIHVLRYGVKPANQKLKLTPRLSHSQITEV